MMPPPPCIVPELLVKSNFYLGAYLLILFKVNLEVLKSPFIDPSNPQINIFLMN